MQDNSSSSIRQAPRLLVSIRDANEAKTAIDSAVDIIDLKEPNRGSLGPVTVEMADEISKTVGDRIPLSLAMGELLKDGDAQRIDDFTASEAGRRVLSRFDYAKVGTAGALSVSDWQDRWLDWAGKLPTRTQPVLVYYVDKAAEPPDLGETLKFAIAQEISTLLFDTRSKDSGHLLDWLPENELNSVLDWAREHRVAIALAGSLSPETVERTMVMGPSIIAVRTAACESGRSSNLCATKIGRLKKILDCASPNSGAVATKISG